MFLRWELFTSALHARLAIQLKNSIKINGSHGDEFLFAVGLAIGAGMTDNVKLAKRII